MFYVLCTHARRPWSTDPADPADPPLFAQHLVGPPVAHPRDQPLQQEGKSQHVLIGAAFPTVPYVLEVEENCQQGEQDEPQEQPGGVEEEVGDVVGGAIQEHVTSQCEEDCVDLDKHADRPVPEELRHDEGNGDQKEAHDVVRDDAPGAAGDALGEKRDPDAVEQNIDCEHSVQKGPRVVILAAYLGRTQVTVLCSLYQVA
eukprot:CAMPEP_0173318954 /NCGR_PEP_ID=MMETSP1143-20121109/27962_1 /TAXON_ID=483371 /ORGANISM="non described non described, Strain CCMP2298" /LENGTH=200 /DNA_ID=CAMNT_0014262293 /DNA_START=160 /DNA_END=762 /DNA_ORIENTATION=-